mmetsp:Transcript_16036/g.39413  ORF Transcript_16036/g.39413 Transcript_16036/m.39413 type:complete len:169 (+) Transcript_16036:431-937(+)
MELVRAYMTLALGEFASSQRDDRSVFAVKQRGMPPGFAATIILEVCGPLEGEADDAVTPRSPTTNQLCMLMPGTAANTVMKVRMGSIPAGELPALAALRRGGTEVTVGGLSTSESAAGGPVTYTFNPSDGSFTAPTERLSAGGLVQIVEDPEGGSVAVVLVKRRAGGG